MHSADLCTARGFTLIELMVSAAIMGILAAIIIPEYAKFDSSTLLENEAYEIATSLREAQVFALSARGTGGTFAQPFGLNFNISGPTQYRTFKGGTAYSGTGDLVQSFTFDRTIVLQDLCVVVSGVENCDPGQLNITFKRPEFEATFDVGGTPANGVIEAAIVKVHSTRGNNIWQIRVGLLGDISVKKI